MLIDKTYLGCFEDPDKGIRLPKRHKTRGVCIHHTCTAAPKRTRAVLKKKGYSTHFEIDRDGRIYQYAALDRKCCHCGSCNFQFVGVDLTHLADAKFPIVQLRALRALCEWLAARLGVPPVIVAELPPGFYFHRAVGDTVCPQDVPEDLLSNPNYAGEVVED